MADAHTAVSGTDPSFIPSLAKVLTHLVSLSRPDEGEVTRFHAVKAPGISVHDYLTRIFKYFGCSNECFVLALVYIDRIVKIHANFTVNPLNIHRLLVTAVMLAAKFFDDQYYSNAYYAKVGGVKTREMNVLEAHFLSLVDYQLYVSAAEYEQYRNNVLLAVQATEPQPAPAEHAPSSTAATTPVVPSTRPCAAAMCGQPGQSADTEMEGDDEGSEEEGDSEGSVCSEEEEEEGDDETEGGLEDATAQARSHSVVMTDASHTATAAPLSYAVCSMESVGATTCGSGSSSGSDSSPGGAPGGGPHHRGGSRKALEVGQGSAGSDCRMSICTPTSAGETERGVSTASTATHSSKAHVDTTFGFGPAHHTHKQNSQLKQDALQQQQHYTRSQRRQQQQPIVF